MAKIKKGDLVVVITGRDRGKQGRVLEVLKDSDRLVVEGVQRVTKHVRAGQTSRGTRTGGIETIEAPIHISNVMLVDPGALLGLRVHQHHVADVDRGLERLDATGPGAAARLAGTDMLGHPLHTLDDKTVGVLEDLQDASLLAAVATRDDDDEVALLDLGHGQSTSGANEMIFMNFLSRSSRPTGPRAA